jgi:hypothetical protein
LIEELGNNFRDIDQDEIVEDRAVRDDSHPKLKTAGYRKVVLQILFCVVEISLVLLQKRMDFKARIETQHPPHLLLGKMASTVSFQCQGFQRRPRKITLLVCKFLGYAFWHIEHNRHENDSIKNLTVAWWVLTSQLLSTIVPQLLQGQTVEIADGAVLGASGQRSK